MSSLSIAIIIMAGIMTFFYGAGTVIEYVIDLIDEVMEDKDGYDR